MTITGRTEGDGTTYYPSEHLFAAGPCERMALRLHADAGLHVYIEAYDTQGRRRASMVRYREGATPWCFIALDIVNTSPNCLDGPLPQGLWRVKVAARPLIPAAEKAYCVEMLEDPDPTSLGIVLDPCGQRFGSGDDEEIRWRAGDLHNHTTMSDGEMAPREKAAFADDAGLDFYAVTDHDILPYSWVPSHALALPGVEITTPNGHFNIICPKEPLCFLPDESGGGINSCESMSSILSKTKASGAFCVLNHPAFPPWHCRWDDFKVDALDALEILCDPTHPGADAATRRAFAIWDAMLLDGRRIWGVGGSDSHMRPNRRYEGADRPSVMGDPKNYVLAAGTPEEIVAALKRGRVTVSRAGILDFSLDAEEKRLLPGDAVPSGTRAQALVSMGAQGILRIVVNGNVLTERCLDGGECRIPISTPDDYGYARAEVLDEAGNIFAFSNPIFFGKQTPKRRTWGDYIETSLQCQPSNRVSQSPYP